MYNNQMASDDNAAARELAVPNICKQSSSRTNPGHVLCSGQRLTAWLDPFDAARVFSNQADTVCWVVVRLVWEW